MVSHIFGVGPARGATPYDSAISYSGANDVVSVGLPAARWQVVIDVCGFGSGSSAAHRHAITRR